ncbi:tissue-type plasminogen activator isoform X2 [Hyperolius riggenbachi]|uniref:tissue-type plasminogen activator isoform X2 n=1 Tax=Hyperolius riggenbachi TaxID=752182 RepID=UPI0035A28095
MLELHLQSKAMKMILTLILVEAVISSQQVLHHREKRGARTLTSLCVEKPLGRIYRGGDTWLRPVRRRVEFCRCEDGRRKCHSVPFTECTETKCYNGGRCRQAVYSSNYLCQCLPGFSGEHCETDLLATCYEGSGQSYRGNHSRTVSGAVCVNWNSPGLSEKRYTAQHREALQLGLGNHNYCRNPDGDAKPWCYVSKGGIYSWEHCSVPQCKADTQDCYSERGTSYRGSHSTTSSGVSCLRWDSPLVKTKAFSSWITSARSLGLGSHNYCRNPDEDVRPWCHVMNGTQTGWEFCDVPRCSTCGVRRAQLPLQPRFRIAGGRGTQITSHPWMASLFQVHKRAEYFFCGGTLIDRCWVLTAAHCLVSLTANKIRVKLGRTIRTERGEQEQGFKVEEIYVHPQFDENTFDNDIALLKLKSLSGSCAMETDTTRPACMPVRGQKLADWTECEISGFGKQEEFSPYYSSQLKEGHVRLYPDIMCTPKQFPDRTVTPNMLCAGDTRHVDDACQGDSGGPLVCLVNGRMHLFGIISWGEGCGRKDKPGVYTRVMQYLDWIEQHTGIRMY